MHHLRDFLWLGVVLSSVAGLIYFLVLIKNYRHVKTAIQVIDAAADFLIEHKRVYLIPVVYYIINLAFVFACIYNILLIMSTNTIGEE